MGLFSSPAPSEVPTLHLHSSSGSSLTLSWAPPERPNGVILDYEMKYFEKVRISRGRRRLGAAQGQDYTQIALKTFGIRASAQVKPGDGLGSVGLDSPKDASILMALQSKGIASTVTSQKNSVQLDGLQPDARYVVQVRARTVAGYGQYSHPAEFETTSERGTPHPTACQSLPWLSFQIPSLTAHP